MDRNYILKIGDNEIELEWGKKYIIGRSKKKSDIVVQDFSVSRIHAEITLGPEKVIIKDLNSSNGTFVNGKPVTSRVELKPGSKIRIGDSILVFEIKQPVSNGEGLSPEATVALEALKCKKCGKMLPKIGGRCECEEKESFDKIVAGKEEIPDLPDEIPRRDFEGVNPLEKTELVEGTSPFEQDITPQFSSEVIQKTQLLEEEVKDDKNTEVTYPSYGPRLASPIRRLFAVLIDSLVVVALSILVVFIAFFFFKNLPFISLISGAFGFLVSSIYFLIFWTMWGATPGKIVLNLVITTDEGVTPLPFKIALLRLIGIFISSVFFGLPFLLIFRKSRKTLHDSIAGTKVVTVKS